MLAGEFLHVDKQNGPVSQTVTLKIPLVVLDGILCLTATDVELSWMLAEIVNKSRQANIFAEEMCLKNSKTTMMSTKMPPFSCFKKTARVGKYLQTCANLD